MNTPREASLKELRPLLRLAAPIAFSQMANMFMQIVDTFFVGKIGPVAIGGVSLGSGLFAIVMVVAVGILLGLDYRVSRAFGAKDYDECQSLLVHGFYLAVFLALPFMGFLELCAHHFEAFGIAPLLSAQAGSYLKVLSFSLLPFLLFSACRQYLQATGTAGPIAMVYIGANLLNAFGNWVFIFGHLGMPALGVAGSGLATTISRTLMFLSLFAYTMHRNKRLNFSIRRVGLRFKRAMASGILQLGLPASGQLLIEVGVFVTSTFLIGRLGATQLAAHQIVLQIASFTFMMPMGISAACAVVVGQALGSRQPGKAIFLGWSSIAIGASVMTVFGMILYFCSTLILGSFTHDQAVISVAKHLLLLAAFFQIFDGVQVVSTGALRGAGNTRASMLANLVGHWVIGLPTGVALCFLFHWNAEGIWVGLTIGLACVATLLLTVWKRVSSEINVPAPAPVEAVRA